MTTPVATRAARRLVAVRAGAARLAALPADEAPATLPEAYAIQREVLRLLGTGIGGWKATLFDARHGICAPLAANGLLRSPAMLDARQSPTAGTQRFGIEPEVAFVMARDLPPLARGERHDGAAVLAAVGSAHAALEIVVSRYVDADAVTQLERVADGFMNEGLVVGPPCTDWPSLDLAALALDVRVDDALVHSGHGGHPLRDPRLPLVWIANHLAGLGEGLRAGQIVTTGSCNGIRHVQAGQRASAHFAGLGAVELAIGAA